MSFLKNVDILNKIEFDNLLQELQDCYYNNQPKISDEEYDSLVDIYETKFGKYKTIGVVGNNQKKVKHTKYLGSLNKATDEKKITLFSKKYKGPYVVSDKIDGLSALTNGIFISTRGDGYIGTDISHLIQYLNIPKVRNGLVRGEIVMEKNVFNEKYKDKSNARNMTSGLVNSKYPNKEELKNLIFLAYEYDNGNGDMSQTEQFSYLKKLGFHIPFYTVINKLDINELTSLVKKRKNEGAYDVDGVVVVNDIATKIIVGENPKHAIAFKIEGECIIAEVKRVEWNVSKLGILNPRIEIYPIKLKDVVITFVTGHNAKYIIDNKIGPKTKLKITRSGDVIPYIKEVIEGTESQLPDVSYTWYKYKRVIPENVFKSMKPNHSEYLIEERDGEKMYIIYEESEVDIMIKEETDDLKKRKIFEFFKCLNAKNLGPATIDKLYDEGFTTLKKIFNITIKELLKIGGIKEKGGERILIAIQSSITNVELSKLIAATGVLGNGIGEKKIQLILDEYPDILEYKESSSSLAEKIERIKGFKMMSYQISENFPKIQQFIKEHPEITIKEEKEMFYEDSLLKNKIIVFTKIRNKELEEKIKNKGGKIEDSITKKTDILVVNKRYEGSNKETKAEKLGNIEILTISEFEESYIN